MSRQIAGDGAVGCGIAHEPGLLRRRQLGHAPSRLWRLWNDGSRYFPQYTFLQLGHVGDEVLDVQGTLQGSVPSRVLQHSQPPQLLQSTWRAGGRRHLYRSDRQQSFRLPERNTGRDQLQPGAWVGRATRDPVGPEVDLLDK